MNDFSTMNCSPNYVTTDPYHLIDYIFRTILPSKGYAVREDQIRLCKTMYVGLTAKHVSICEAEVGTGKTMAYLVAAIVAKRMLERKETDCLTVTIATSSIELQKSILEKEIPLLSTLLQHYGICSRPLTAVLRKGKEHYICRMRFEDFLSNIRRFPEKYEKIINYFSSDGFIERVLDLDKLKIPPAIKSKISASMSCLKCKYSDNCRYRTFVRNATRSINLDFQVANHNFYLAALRHYKEDGAMLLHPGSLVIIDEAHKLKEAAETAFGESLSQKDIPTYLNAIKYNGDQSRSYSQLIEKTYSMNQLLFDRIKGLLDSNDDNRLLALSSTELSIITQLIHYINTIESRQRMNLRHPYANINRLLTTLTTICKRTSINIWAETNANGMITLGCSPQNINLVMEQNVWDEHSHYVLTSGTMSDGNNFNYFMHENGLDRINHHCINQSRTASPFDYYNHTRLYIPDDMPFPDNNSSEYIHSIANQILQLIEATNGHTAILFTSYKVLYKVHEIVADQLGKYTVICMTKSNRTAISDFKKCENGILFASGSMWEGVDCIGDCLSSIIIVRLPFPIRSMVLEAKKQACTDVQRFIDLYVVPEMLIKLRQGIGRLVRCETDTGLIAILDSRAYSGVYADRIENVLKQYPRVFSIRDIEAFFKMIKNEEYFNA